MKRNKVIALVGMALIGIALTATAAEQAGNKQEKCPVMGGKINKALYADVNGKRIYTCCPGCIGKIKADPAKYIKQLEAKGIELDKATAKKDTSASKSGCCGH